MPTLPIGFFAPLPLPVMIPFMTLQSSAMAEAFGMKYQYGKRKISSMSNEEFNKLTPAMIDEQVSVDIRNAIPAFQNAMPEMLRLQTIIIQNVFDMIKQIPTDVISGISGGQGGGGSPATGLVTSLLGMNNPLSGLADSLVQKAYGEVDTGSGQFSIKDVTPGSNYINPQMSVGTQIPPWLQAGYKTELEWLNAEKARQSQQASTQQQIQTQNMAAAQASLTKKNLPSDPRTILSKRTELIQQIAAAAKQISDLKPGMEQTAKNIAALRGKSQSGLSAQQQVLENGNRMIRDLNSKIASLQQELTTLLNTWNF